MHFECVYAILRHKGFGLAFLQPTTSIAVSLSHLAVSCVLSSYTFSSYFSAYRLWNQQDVCADGGGEERGSPGQRHPLSASVHRHRFHQSDRSQRESLLWAQPKTHQTGGGNDARVHADHIHSTGPRSLHAANYQVRSHRKSLDPHPKFWLSKSYFSSIINRPASQLFGRGRILSVWKQSMRNKPQFVLQISLSFW